VLLARISFQEVEGELQALMRENCKFFKNIENAFQNFYARATMQIQGKRS
jgi:hypothetical protein